MPGPPGSHLPTAPDGSPVQQAEAEASRTTAGPEDTGRPLTQEAGASDPSPPQDWEERIGLLPSSTLVHIPSAARVRMATAITEIWEGMANGLPGWSRLGQGFLKLVLTSIPDGAHVPKEVAIRIGLWQNRHFEDLLRRVEAHASKLKIGGRKKNVDKMQRVRLRCIESQSRRVERNAEIGWNGDGG